MREKFNKLVDYFRNKVCSLFSNKNQDTYKEIVDYLYNNVFTDDKDYNKIHIKPVVQKKERAKKKDELDIEM